MKNHFKTLSLFFVLIGLIVLSGCAGVETTSVKTTERNLNEEVKYHGPKARIAVASFKCKAAKCYGEIGSGIRDMLVDALVKSGKFIVLERGEGLSAIQEEMRLAESGYIQPQKAPQKGLMEGADILVVGSIIAFEPEAGGLKGTVGGLLKSVPLIGGVSAGMKEAYIALNLRLIDVRTGRIINSTTVEGKASSFNVGAILGGILNIPLGVGLSKYKNTPMEKAIMVMLNEAVKKISELVPEEYYRYSDTGKPIKPLPVQTTQKQQVAQQTSQPQTTQTTQVIQTSQPTSVKREYTGIEGPWHGVYRGRMGSGEWSWVIEKNPDGTYRGVLNTSGTYPGRNIPITIKINGNKISIGWVAGAPVVGAVAVTFNGVIEGNKMHGTWAFSNGMDSGTWEGYKGATALTPQL